MNGSAGEGGCEGIEALKPPVWKWEIPVYFFLSGLSAGSFLLARLADRFGRGRFRRVTRAGTAISAAAFAPCPALLINDLGDPRRFHHMLRVFKPRSPMNFGAWSLLGYGAVMSLSVFREWYRAIRPPRNRPERALDSAVAALTDAAGLPAALLMTGYTGVLLSTTSIPVWAQNPWLGPLFSSSALSTAASAIDLALMSQKQSTVRTLGKVETAARAVESVALAGYLAEAGNRAAPLTRGESAPLFWTGAVAAGLVTPALLDRAGRRSHNAVLAGAALTLAGALALRWAIVRSGHESARRSRPD